MDMLLQGLESGLNVIKKAGQTARVHGNVLNDLDITKLWVLVCRDG